MIGIGYGDSRDILLTVDCIVAIFFLESIFLFIFYLIRRNKEGINRNLRKVVISFLILLLPYLLNFVLPKSFELPSIIESVGSSYYMNSLFFAYLLGTIPYVGILILYSIYYGVSKKKTPNELIFRILFWSSSPMLLGLYGWLLGIFERFSI